MEGLIKPVTLYRGCELLLVCLLHAGCGTTQTQLATQQLILSDAVDRAVAQLDFRVLAGQKVYLDDRFIQNVKGIGFVNSEYVTSALRQQMLASGCLLQPTANDADYIVEARVGTLGHDQHDVTYGIPANKSLANLVDLVPNAPDLPSIPELSLARRHDQLAAAKIAAYAYDRRTREPVWQSGTAVPLSDAKSSWFFGIGPFQTGTIYPEPRFAGDRLLSLFRKKCERFPTEPVAFPEAYTFKQPGAANALITDSVQPASHQAPDSPQSATGRRSDEVESSAPANVSPPELSDSSDRKVAP